MSPRRGKARSNESPLPRALSPLSLRRLQEDREQSEPVRFLFDVGRSWEETGSTSRPARTLWKSAHDVHQLQLLSPRPRRWRAFLRTRTTACRSRATVSVGSAPAPQRRVLLAKGPANQLNFAAYAFGNDAALHAYREGIEARIAVEPGVHVPCLRSQARPPVVRSETATGSFSARTTRPHQSNAPALSARLQHFAIQQPGRTRDVQLPFYRDTLGLRQCRIGSRTTMVA